MIIYKSIIYPSQKQSLIWDFIKRIRTRSSNSQANFGLVWSILLQLPTRSLHYWRGKACYSEIIRRYVYYITVEISFGSHIYIWFAIAEHWYARYFGRCIWREDDRGSRSFSHGVVHQMFAFFWWRRMQTNHCRRKTRSNLSVLSGICQTRRESYQYCTIYYRVS